MSRLISVMSLLAVPLKDAARVPAQTAPEGLVSVDPDRSAAKGFVEEMIAEAAAASALGISVVIVARLLGWGGTKPKSSKKRKAAAAPRVCKATMAPPTVSACANPDPQPPGAPAAQWPRSPSDPIEAAASRLVTAIHAGRAAMLPQLLDEAMARLAQPGPVHAEAKATLAARLLLSSVRSCASNWCFQEALAAYAHMESMIGNAPGTPWSLLLWSAVEAGQTDLGNSFARKLCAAGDISQQDFVNIVRCAVHYKDMKQLVEILEMCTASGMKLELITRNRALAALTSGGAMDMAAELVARTADVPLDVISYNTMMKGFAQGRPKLSLQLYEQMRVAGLAPSDITYGIILEACMGGAMFEDARRIFDDLRSSGRHANAVHYTIYIRGLVAAGRLAEACDVLAEMHAAPHAKPDLATYTILTKAYAAIGGVDDCIRLLETMRRQGVEPDGVLVNIALSACGAKPMWGNKILEAFERVVGMGFQPSNMTYATLIKACARTESWGVALSLLRGAHGRFGFEPHASVYTKLAQACASARAAPALMETHSLLVQGCRARGEAVDAATKLRFVHFFAACDLSEGSIMDPP